MVTSDLYAIFENLMYPGFFLSHVDIITLNSDLTYSPVGGVISARTKHLVEECVLRFVVNGREPRHARGRKKLLALRLRRRPGEPLAEEAVAVTAVRHPHQRAAGSCCIMRVMIVMILLASRDRNRS